MLAISPSSSSSSIKEVTPNILPCSIKHSGPIPTSKRYWSPTAPSHNPSDKTSTAYFRGRKLRGKTLKLPDGYQGVVLQKTDTALPRKAPTVEERRRMEEDDLADVDDEMDVETVEVKVMEQMARFDEVVVWGHEMVPEDEDVYVKGVGEWIGFAEAMHSYEDPDQGATET